MFFGYAGSAVLHNNKLRCHEDERTLAPWPLREYGEGQHCLGKG